MSYNNPYMFNLEFFLNNLLCPAFLFFWLGVGLKHLNREFSFPKSFHNILSLFLLLAIGFKGGCILCQESTGAFQDLLLIFSGLIIGIILPFFAYFCLKKTTSLDRTTAAAVAAHYGSISVVTFAAALNLLAVMGIPYKGVMIALMALLEAPAIFSGLLIAGKDSQKTLIHALMHPTILLLLGGFFIGAVCPEVATLPLKTSFESLFPAALTLFLFSMGVQVREEASHLGQIPLSVLLFGIYMPLCGSFFGLGAASLLGLDRGTTLLLMTLCASASYIAVPATMRLALPQANTAIYLPLSLAITFPFNVTVGIPLYLYLAELVSKILF